MNIVLIGYGKMGRTIEAMGLKQGQSFPLIIDENNRGDLIAAKEVGIDVAIEFTTPTAAPDNINACINLGVPVVSGTTGWKDRLDEVKAYCLEMNGALFHASNFSIGVNILFAMNRRLAQIMRSFPSYSASMKEVHHIHKLDAPSGTAITLAEQILEENPQVEKWELKEPGKESTGGQGVMPIEAVREGEEKGFHAVSYESDMETLTVSHSAKTRDAFAAGALQAAEFLIGKKGIFGMSDLLKI